MALPTFAATGNSIDTVVEELSELYQEEAEKGKELEESVQCRIIVKANRKPDTYGDATLIKGTDKIYIYQYSNVTSANAALEYYNSLSYVQWAETDGIMEGQSLSYGNDMMGSDEAKNYIVNNNISTNEVNVALIDTGVKFTNEMFADRVVDSGINLSSDGRENSAYDNNGHGSHIASILVDSTSDNVKVTAYKVTNKYNQGTHLSVAQGIEKAINDGADIINLSITSKEKSELIIDAVKNAYNKGVIIVNSAGNASDDVANYYPANMYEVFTVGAIDKNGNRAFFSNFGEKIDFVAPGHLLEMSGYNSKDSTDSGTSFSVPFIAAAAAMVLSVSPNLNIEQVKQQLINSCVSMKDLAYYDNFHPVEEYIPEFANYFAVDDPETEEECYGYGMPQILKSMNIAEQNSSVAFSVESGIYHNEFELVLSADDGAEIYYTTDESYPSANNSKLYTKPILVDETTSVRAIAVSDNKSKSVPIACEYKMAYYADENDFKVDNRGYITKYNGNLKELIVPEKINNITVTGVAENAFSHCRRIIFPATVKVIAGKNEFSAIDSDIEFIEGKGITRLEDYALCDTDNLLVLDAPNLEYVGSNALFGKFRVIDYPKLKYVDEWTFAGNKHLKEVFLPSLEAVPYSCFKDCYVLRTVNLNDTVSIDTDAFAYCYRLKNIFAPKLNSLLATDIIDVGTFHRCYNLIEVDFPFVTEVPESCFNECLKLEKVKFDNALVIKYSAFNLCQKLSSIYFPKVEIIEQMAFYEAYNLKNADFPSVEIIKDKAFVNTGIETINALNLKRLGCYAFAELDDFHHIWLINSSLTTFIAPNLYEADDYAFAYTGGLTKLDLPNLKSVGNNAFYESSVNHLYVPNLVKANSLPVTENSKVVLSSEFKECSLDSRGYDLTIYGTPNTYAQEYAENNKLKFVPLPILVIEPPMEYTDINDKLSVEVFGFNKTYQWYGTYEPDNYSGEIINGATDSEFNPNDFKAYPYYYCVINTVDGEYKAELRTGVSKDLASPADYSEYNKVVEQAKSLIEGGLYGNIEELEKLINMDISGKIIAEQKDVNVHTELIIEAISELKYKDADYSKVDELISKIPADLTVYTDESVAELNSILNSIERNLPVTEQNIVDDYADRLEQAINQLEYKKADLDKLNQAIKSVPDDLSIYTDDSAKALTKLLEKAEEYDDADIIKQEEINTLAQQIYDAVDSLEKKEVPTEPTKPTPPDEPSTESSIKPTTNPSENPTKPSEITTEKPSASQNSTTDSGTKDNQNITKRNTDMKSPLTGNDHAYIIISVAVVVSFSVLFIVSSKRKKKGF